MILNISMLACNYIDYFTRHLDLVVIVISISALILSIISFIFNRKDKKIEHDYSMAIKDFEVQKEKIRRFERNDDKFENRMNLITTLKPYFDIKLHGDDFDTDNINGSLRLKIGIGLINIGKDTAVNVNLFPYNSSSEFLFENNDDEENRSLVDIYFSDGYVKVGEVIKLRIIKDILDADRDNQSIKFKIKYNDLIGNLYEQEFKITYSNYMFGGFERENKSYPPQIIEYADNKSGKTI